MGNGLLARIYHTKSKLTSSKKDLYLGGKTFKALRNVLVEKFPKIPVLSLFEDGTLPGGQRFISNSLNTCRVLTSYRDLLYDIVEFAHASTKLILDAPAQYINMGSTAPVVPVAVKPGDPPDARKPLSSAMKQGLETAFSFETNREGCMRYLSLISIYVRVMLFFSSMKEEGKTMYCLYAAACQCLHSSQLNNTAAAFSQHAQMHADLSRLDLNENTAQFRVDASNDEGSASTPRSPSKQDSKAKNIQVSTPTASSTLLNNKKKQKKEKEVEDLYSANIHVLFEQLSDTKRHFIDHFSDIQPILHVILMGLRTTIFTIGSDLGALVRTGALDIVNANHATNPRDFGSGDSYGTKALVDTPGTKHVGSISTLPLDQVKLFPGSNLNLYTEIADAPIYRPYIMFAVVCCPLIMLDPDILPLVTNVAEEGLVVNIYRDFNFSVHTALEELSLTFPDKTLDPAVVVPKGLKLKTTLKASARHAVKGTPDLHTYRRSVLNTQLHKCLVTLRASPGLVAPKLPLLQALASLARDEIHSYYRHLGKIAIRRDCKSLYRYEEYISTLTNSEISDVGLLLANLVRLTNLIREFRVIIVNYYSEYLSGAYLKTLIPVINQVASFFPLVQRTVRPLVEDLLQGTSLIDLKRIPKMNESGSSLEASNAVNTANCRPVRLASIPALSIERLRTDWRDLWFSEALLDNAEHNYKSMPTNSHAHTTPFDGIAIAQHALKTAADIPLVTGDVYRLSSLRLNWAMLLSHLHSIVGAAEMHHAVSGNAIQSSKSQETASRRVSGSDDIARTTMTNRPFLAEMPSNAATDVIANMESIHKLCKLMHSICHMSRYIDALPGLLEEYFEPVELWWYRDHVLESFSACLEAGTDQVHPEDINELDSEADENNSADADHSDESRSSMAFMYVNALALRSLHKDCPSEIEPLCASICTNLETMLDRFSKQCISSFDQLWKQDEKLYKQTNAIEAAHRMARMLRHRETGDPSEFWEPNPGFESMPTQRSTMLDLLRYRYNLTHIVASANEFCNMLATGVPVTAWGAHALASVTTFPPTTGFICLDKQYHLGVYLQQHLCSHIEGLISQGEIFFVAHSNRNGPSICNPIENSIAHLVSGVHVLQTILNNNGFSSSTTTALHPRHATAASHAHTEPHGLVAGSIDRTYAAYTAAKHSATTNTNIAHNHSNFDFVGWLRMILFKEFSDTAHVEPPGKLINPNIHPRTHTVVWRVASWFLWLVDQANSAGTEFSKNTQPLVWLSNLKALATLEFRNGFDEDSLLAEPEDEEMESKRSNLPFKVHTYVDRREMRAMAKLLGSQGLRCVDTLLLHMFTTIIKDNVKPFLWHHQESLRDLTANYKNDPKCMSRVMLAMHTTNNKHSLTSITLDNNASSLNIFMISLIKLGLGLVLREALYKAARENCLSSFPAVVEMFDTLCAAVDAFAGYTGTGTAPQPTTPAALQSYDDCVALYDLASVLGCRSREGLDVALLNAISRECFSTNKKSVSIDMSATSAIDDQRDGKSFRKSVRVQSGTGNAERQMQSTSQSGSSPSRDRKQRATKIDTNELLGVGSGSEGSSKWNYNAFAANEAARSIDAKADRELENIAQSEFNALFQYLPAACACLYLSDLWHHTTYWSQIDTWMHNEHVLPKAIETLLLAFCGRARSNDPPIPSPIGSKTNANAKSRIAPRTMPAELLWSSQQVRLHTQQQCASFIEISSHVLLHQKECAMWEVSNAQEIDTPKGSALDALGSGAMPSELLGEYSLRPIGCMMLTLETFAIDCPLAGRGVLEKCLPYAMLHHALLDISLGKKTEIDERQPF